MWGLQFHPEMPFEESERLVRSNSPRHEHIDEPPEDLLARAVDVRPIGLRLFANFLDHVDAARSPR